MTRDRSPIVLHPAAMALAGAGLAAHLALWTRSLALSAGLLASPGRALLAGLCLGACMGAFLAKGRTASAPLTTALNLLLALICCGTGLALHLKAMDLTLVLDPYLTSHGALAGSAFAALCGVLPGLILAMLLTLALNAGFKARPGNRGRACALGADLAAGAALGLIGLALLLDRGSMTFAIMAATITQALAGALALAPRPFPAPAAESQAQSVQAIQPGRDARAWAYAATALASGAAAACVAVVGRHLAECFLAPAVHADLVYAALALLLPALGWALAMLAPRGLRAVSGSRPGIAALLILMGLGTILALRLLIQLVMAPGYGFPHLASWPGLLAALALLAPMFLGLGLLCCLLAARSRSAGANGPGLGALLALGSLGGCLGLIWTTFFGLSDVGAMPVLSLAALICLALAVAVLLDDFQAGAKAAAITLLALAVLGLALLKPPAHPALALMPGQVLFRSQDSNGLFAASLKVEQTVLATNDLNLVHQPLDTVAQARSQQMPGHLALAYFPNAESALVLGSGNLMAAGVLARYPHLVRLEVVEALPETVDALDVLGPSAYLVNEASNVTWRADSPRRFLTACEETFDILVVSAPDPGAPEAAPLFTLEAMVRMRGLLNQGGLLVLRAKGPGLPMLSATIRRAFAHLLLFPDGQDSLLILASDQALELDPALVRWLATDPMVADVLELVGMTPEDLPQIIQDSAMTPEDLPELFEFPAQPLTDDRPILHRMSRAGQGGPEPGNP